MTSVVPSVDRKPRLLDLFAGAHGAGRGYELAGFHVTSVDNNPELLDSHPGQLIICDAFEYLAEHGHEYDLIHAGPPCQDYSPTRSLHTTRYPRWIAPLRMILDHLGRPYVIENVAGARATHAQPDHAVRIQLRSRRPPASTVRDELADRIRAALRALSATRTDRRHRNRRITPGTANRRRRREQPQTPQPRPRTRSHGHRLDEPRTTGRSRTARVHAVARRTLHRAREGCRVMRQPHQQESRYGTGRFSMINAVGWGVQNPGTCANRPGAWPLTRSDNG